MEKIYPFLFCILMLTAPLAGCLGGDDDEVPLVGEWWTTETMALDFNEDGILIDYEGNSGTWSTDGDILTMTIQDERTFKYAVEGDWLWLQIVDDDDCQAFSSESINEDEWDDRVSELTPPSFC